MKPAYLALLGLAAAATASAQDQFTVGTEFLEADSTQWYASGVGSPAVAYDQKAGEFVMLFESQIEVNHSGCPDGGWAIGKATSDDGLEWNVLPYPLIAPTPGTYYECGAREPAMMRAGNMWHVWFTASQGTGACLTGPPSWGCEQHVGIGYGQMRNDRARILGAPVLVGTDLSAPTVVRTHGTLQMLVVKGSDVYGATSDNGREWTLDEQHSLHAGVTSWATDQLFSPAVVCDDREDYEYTMYFGGHNLVGEEIVWAGWGRGVSDNADFWFIDPVGAFFTWSGSAEWRSFDVLRAGVHFLMWFEETGDDGRSRIGFASTTEDWLPEEVADRDCL